MSGNIYLFSNTKYCFSVFLKKNTSSDRDFSINHFRKSIHFVLLKDRSRSEELTLIKHQNGVSGILVVNRFTFICKTPGYHHMGASSNAVTRDYFTHNATIWSKIYLILFIKYELSIVLKNENWHRVAEKSSDFSNTKFFSDYFL